MQNIKGRRVLTSQPPRPRLYPEDPAWPVPRGPEKFGPIVYPVHFVPGLLPVHFILDYSRGELLWTRSSRETSWCWSWCWSGSRRRRRSRGGGGRSCHRESDDSVSGSHCCCCCCWWWWWCWVFGVHGTKLNAFDSGRRKEGVGGGKKYKY